MLAGPAVDVDQGDDRAVYTVDEIAYLLTLSRSTALGYAVELGLLETNPVRAIKWKAPKSVQVVDRRSVANPVQARRLLDTVATTPHGGGRLVGFFACMYYSATTRRCVRRRPSTSGSTGSTFPLGTVGAG